MKRNKAIFYSLIMLYFLVVFNLLTFFTIFVVSSFLTFSGIEIDAGNELATYFLSDNQYFESTFFAVLFGALFLTVQELSEKYRLDKKGFITVIMVKTGVYVAGMVAIAITTYFLMELIIDYPEGTFSIMGSGWFTTLWIMMMLFIISQIVLLNYFNQTNKKIGLFNLRSFLTGKYQTPVEEDRVFLFIDLKSSTHHAETMGNINYSRMIKDCFDDINFAIKNTPGEIYQYVGDEVVITWTMEEAVKNLAALDCYFQIENELSKRKAYYESKYGVMPAFKGGMHGGKVTVVEIGIVKKEIAFHGDVLNTASRIQNYCNTLGKPLLISGYLKISFPYQTEFEFNLEGRYLLKGKENEIDIYSVSKKKDYL